MHAIVTNVVGTNAEERDVDIFLACQNLVAVGVHYSLPKQKSANCHCQALPGLLSCCPYCNMKYSKTFRV